MCQMLQIDHGNGKVSLLQEKGEDGLDIRRKDTLTNILPTANLEGDMQRERMKTEVGTSKPIEKIRHTKASREMGLEVKEYMSWANDNSSPLAISFNQEKGWVAETLGPKSGHWKRLARQSNKPSPIKKVSLEKTKRIGLVPYARIRS